jgi:tetratricopeptide (TPR) repeat protein
MSVGHGGQILLSSSTQRLLIDELPDGVGLLSLGVHALKDLDRSEEIFQVVAGDLATEFPPLHTEPNSEAGPGGQAAHAFDEKDWERVVDLLTQLEADSKLTGRQHEMMGFALWWLGRHDRIVSRFEHAYHTFMAEGDSEGAASAALELAELHAHSLAADVATGWVRRAERLLEGDEESSARGYLLRWQAVAAFEKDKDLDLAISLSEKVAEIGRANMDGNLEVLALQDQGRFLVAAGRLDEGMPLMDEAMIAAVAGDVTPINVGRSYCNMLAVCDQTGDIRRAAEWTKTAEEWCQESESSPYPGVCRIFKAEMMWLNGDWVGAESEVMRASGELGLYTDISGEAWYQYGVMRVRAGDYEGAEEAFQEALTRGREPAPGYAYVLRHQGLADSAVDMLQRSLADPSVSKLDRARFLPALAEFSLDQGDTETSRRATEELEEIGQLARSDYFLAQAAHRRGLIELMEEPSTAINSLRMAVKAFSKLRLPYESAKARSDLAKAYIADGAQALATLELKSAKAEFERLGSTTDAELAEALLPQ